MVTLDRESLLKVWLTSEPTARSPYGRYGYPPMWKTLECGAVTLFTRPGKTMERPAPYMPDQEVDGVHYQWARTKDGMWLDQGCQATFEYVKENVTGAPLQATKWLTGKSLSEACAIAREESKKLVRGSYQIAMPEALIGKCFNGRIVEQTDFHLIQKVGPKYLVHNIDSLQSLPKTGERVEIRYEHSNQKALVSSGAEIVKPTVDQKSVETERQRFDWSTRVGEPVLTMPFEEGLPTQEKAAIITAWVKANSDRYANSLVKLYHATDPSLPIEDDGLKPTSTTRRRSYQSENGYVYLAATPDRAKIFGDLGNQGRSVVYEVLVRVRHLLPDKDQLNNQRSVGKDVGNSVGESVVYGGGARVKGRIEPWAIRKLDDVEVAAMRNLSAKDAPQITKAVTNSEQHRPILAVTGKNEQAKDRGR